MSPARLLALLVSAVSLACTAGPPPAESETMCADGLDEDQDGATDCDDDACAGRPYVCKTHRSTRGEEAACTNVATTPEDCGNGVDDDSDGLPDCLDCDCCGEGACNTRACGCDRIDGTWTTATPSAVGLAAPDETCPPMTFDFQLTQSGCAVKVKAINSDTGAFLPLEVLGDGRYRLEGSLDQSTSVTNVWDFDFTFDPAKGTFTGTSKRTQGNRCDVVGWR